MTMHCKDDQFGQICCRNAFSNAHMASPYQITMILPVVSCAYVCRRLAGTGAQTAISSSKITLFIHCWHMHIKWTFTECAAHMHPSLQQTGLGLDSPWTGPAAGEMLEGMPGEGEVQEGVGCMESACLIALLPIPITQTLSQGVMAGHVPATACPLGAPMASSSAKPSWTAAAAVAGGLPKASKGSEEAAAAGAVARGRGAGAEPGRGTKACAGSLNSTWAMASWLSSALLHTWYTNSHNTDQDTAR